MTYTPNFSDPRVRRCTERALIWTETYIKPSQAHWLSSREIQRHLGSLSRPLGKYLKEQLLICVDSYFNMSTGVCKSYKLNEQGFRYLCDQIAHKSKLQVTAQTLIELSTGEFEYIEKSHREYHPLQNLPKRIKKPLLTYNGYRYEYDIQCCAQSLILQKAQAVGYKKSTLCLDQYINDRATVRLNLSERLGLDQTTIKKILTAILNGGSISVWHTNMIFSYVNYNRLMIDQLRSDAYIQGYQAEVRGLWDQIRKTKSLRKGERFNAKMKSEVYRELEDSVRSVIKRYLRKNKIKAFIEHDGWSSDKPVDIDRLCWEVKQQTGFVIKLDWTIHEYIEAY